MEGTAGVTTVSSPYTGSQESEACVSRQIADGRDAMAAVARYDQDAVDDLARAAAWAVLREDRCTDLTACYARETEMGTQQGTREKIQRFIRGGLADILGEPSVGRIGTDRPGVIEVAKPVGVIGALIPSTNPASTTACLAMMALKGRNSIIISPPPTAAATTEQAVSYIREELARIDEPQNLVQVLDRPITREKARELLETADFAQVTGSTRNVEAGETSGTPNYCVGAGNTTAIVDETADVEAAAAALATGVAFDNGAVCTSESNVVVDERVAGVLVDGLRKQGGYICSAEESASVAVALFKKNGHRRRALVAQSASDIAATAGIDAGTDTEFLVLRGRTDIDRPTFAREKLAPVVTVYTDRGFTDLLTCVSRILDVEGAGHSCVLHTDRDDRIEQVAREVDVCRVVVNQAGALGLPGAGDGLDTTLSLGAGVWGGNQLDENLTYRHFITTTRVACPLADGPPSDPKLFDNYDGFRSLES
jgi:sulfoacetaldehyde dehydrogenase